MDTPTESDIRAMVQMGMDSSDVFDVVAALRSIESKLDEVLVFRDLLLETAGPFLTGGKSKVWLALLAKSKGGRTT